MEDSEYHLDDPGDNILIETKNAKIKKLVIILVSIIIFLVLIIIIGILIFFTVFKKEKKKDEKEEVFPDISVYYDIKTSEKNIIKNSFRKGAENYIKELGDINRGEDYQETERDNFDLCIPKTIMKNKEKYTPIQLNIHGGGWVQGEKQDVISSCKGSKFILASMSYTLLDGRYEDSNIFRIIDEITAVIKTLKNFLIEKGFGENKLELVLAGGSAGAHLSLLYSYMIKNPPIPIKYILNGAGPVSLDPDNFLQTKKEDEPLKNIEPNDIEEAKNEHKIIHMNGNATGVEMKNIYLINFMNGWLGKKLNDSIEEIIPNLETMEINKSSKKFQEMLINTSYAYPINYVTHESIPTLCIYGGKDDYIGVVHYSKLKEAFLNKTNNNITLVYFPYGKHDYSFNSTEREINYLYNEIGRYSLRYLEAFK